MAKTTARNTSLLIVLYQGMGSITCRVRGLIYAEPLRRLGWTVDFVEYAAVSQASLVALAKGFDLVYLLKVPSISLVRALRRDTSARLIFDLTDALWMPHHRWNQWQDLEHILTDVDAVFSDNEFVADYGRRHNANTFVIEPCSQVEEFDAIRTLVPRRDDGIVRIGWVGTASTLSALEVIREPLNVVFSRHANLHLRILALNFRGYEQLPQFDFRNWSVVSQYDEALMIREVLNLDIGLFPPPCGLEDYRIRGALKGIVYMTGELPIICQRGGTLDTLIEDGVNGMLAGSLEEWESKLETLIQLKDFRTEMGSRALETVRQFNSLEAISLKLHTSLNSVLALRSRGRLVTDHVRCVLIVCSHFWPSVGGLESRMGQFSRNLLQHGYRVVVLTQIFPGREGNDFHGVEVQAAEPIQFPEMVRSYVASGRYDACVLVQDPLGVIIWSLEGLIPPPETRVLIQPIINEDGYERWRDHPNFGQRLANILRHTGRTIIMTRDGPDARFMQSVDIEPEFIPNAAKPAQIAGDFRAQLGLKPEDFLILHVANLHWVKNHAGLIDTLQDIPSNWKLVMVGNTSGEPDCVQTVCGKLALRPEILFVPGLSKEWISAAMESADVVVLASKGEGSPITILEAMAHGRPWIATPQCGAANEHLGGFICDLPAFRHRLELLFNAPHLRVQIGAVGHAHWKQCYSWDVVMPAWIELIEKGKLDREFIPDSHLVERMSQLRQQLLLSSDSLETLDSVIAEVYALDVMEIITIAQQHAERGETQRAVVIYRAWLTRDQHSLRFAVEYNLGTILENSGSLGAAREAYQCALALAPGLEVAKTALGRIRKRTEIF